MEDLVGQTLGHHKLVALLGEGGMGAVFRARDMMLQRDVAIKVMHPHLARQPGFQERFLQEARTAARLNHPGIVPVHDFGQEGDRLYIVMKFIPGDNLGQMLKDLRDQGQWIALDEAVQLVRQLSLAVDYAHRHGVLHRDVKPGNVMIEPEPTEGLSYRPILTDLGLAKLAEGGLVTEEGVSMGTPAYMSPEQALGEKIDARSDVYSLGILLYELTVGRLPFPIKTISEAIKYHTKEPPPPPHSIRPGLPPSLERVTLRAIAKQPADRFPDAAALAVALADLQPGVTRVAAASLDQENAVSLKTQYQASLVKLGDHPVPDFPSPRPDLAQDQLQIQGRDKTARSVPVKAGKITIGRTADNDIAIDDPEISRCHARIERSPDGAAYRVVDLESTNGTFLGDVKLLPGVPEVWLPEVILRVGDTWLRQVRAQRPGPTGAAPRLPDGTLLDPSRIRTSLGGRVGVFVETAQLVVEPGSSVSFPVLLLNQGAQVDHFQVAVEGIPAGWVPASPPLVRLMPGKQESVTLTIRPPRAPQSRAGQHSLAVRVTSQDKREVAEVPATLTVAAYHQFSLDVRPQKQSSAVTGTFRVPVGSQGNADLTLRFEGVDPEDGCYYLFDPPQMVVPPGEERAVQLTVQPKARLAGETARTFPFTVTARPLEAPELTQRVQGTWVQTPPPPEPKKPLRPCYNHPDVEAVAVCTSCGQAVCEACAVEVGGRIHCKPCLATGADRVAPAKVQPAKQKPRFGGCLRWFLYFTSFWVSIVGLIVGIMLITQDDQESKQVGQNCLIAMILGFVAQCLCSLLWFVLVGGLMFLPSS